MVMALRRNFGFKLLSVFLAILGWAYFRFADNPVLSARFDQQVSVPITAVNIPNGYIARFPDKTAMVTIQPGRGQPPLKPDEIKAVVDLSNRSSGVYNIPVQLVAPNVVVQSLSPASVTLTLEKLDERTFPIAMYYGAPTNVVVRNFRVTPQSVSVRGPESDLSQVATVRVNMPLNRAQSTIDEMIRPVAVDSSGNEITDVQVAPNLVRVQANLQPASGVSK